MNNKEYLKAMGAKMKAARKAKDYSVRKLGELCKLDYSYISRVENGQYSCKILNLKTIADVLGVDVKDFL